MLCFELTHHVICYLIGCQLTNKFDESRISKRGTMPNHVIKLFQLTIKSYLLFLVVDEYPVLKADAIKYVITFRSVVSREIV